MSSRTPVSVNSPAPPSSVGSLSSVSSSLSSLRGPQAAKLPPRKRAGSGGVSSPGSNNVQVVCRFRPTREPDALKWFEINEEKSVHVKLADRTLDFNFDRIFSQTAEQKNIYEAVEHVVHGVMEGFNGSILSYGQTSSGKTHTMLGRSEPGQEGVVPRAMESLFKHVAESGTDTEFTFKCSYVELYCEKINDLLSPNNENLKIREDPQEGIVIAGVTEVYVSSRAEVMKLLELGRTLRATSSTLMNAESSRSHALLFVTVTQKDVITLHVRRGKLVLVDLAGSEKVSKTGAEGLRLEEAKNINRSLTTLGMVIKALADGQPHVPTRDSKLTRVLEESLGGNSRTTLIICCAPELIHSSETVSTLRFGDRAKQIKNRAVVNEEMSVVELKSLLEKAHAEIAQLKAMVNALRAEKGLPPLLLPPPPPGIGSHLDRPQALAHQQLGSDGSSNGVADEQGGPLSLVIVSPVPGKQPLTDEIVRSPGSPLGSPGFLSSPLSPALSPARSPIRSPAGPSEAEEELRTRVEALMTKLANKESEKARLDSENRELAARLAEEEQASARYEEEVSTLTTRVGEAEAQVEQLMRLKTAEPVPTAVMEKAYGISSPTAASRTADLALGVGVGGVGSPKASRTAELEASLRNGPIMPPSSPLSASVYDKKLESVEKIIYALQDELYEQQEAFKTVIKSKSDAFKELLQQNGELVLQKEKHQREIFSMQCKMEELERAVTSLSSSGGLLSYFGIGSGGSKVVKPISGGGGSSA